MKEFQYDPTHSKIQYVSKFVPALLEDNCFKIVYWLYIFLRELYWLNAALLN